MSHKIGKIRTERSNLVRPGDQVYAPIISTGGTLNLEVYEDITSIDNWVVYGDVLCTDILQVRDRIKEELDAISWSGLTNTQKDIVIEYYLKETNKDEATSNTEKVVYLMTSKGYSPLQAQGVLIKAYGSYHPKEVYACNKRANTEKLYEVIAKYLTLADAGDLIKITHKLFDLYKTQAIRGTQDGNAGEGLFNFLESTPGTSYETTGLEQQGYTLSTGTYSEFITELMDVLRHGNY